MTIIAEAIEARLSHVAAATQPRFDDVEEGAITEAVLGADDTKRDELDHIIDEVSGKLHES